MSVPFDFWLTACYKWGTDATYILSDPQIMGGEPVIVGTRTPIAVILYRLKEGNSIEAIHQMYPWIDVPTLSGAIEEVIRTVTQALHAKTVSQTQTAS